MDLITHALAGYAISLHDREERWWLKVSVVAGSLIPDSGEILIQRALAQKYGAFLAVYDERTSDPLIANDLSVTWLYDLLHAPCMVVVLLVLGVMLVRAGPSTWYHNAGQISKRLAIGISSQVVLDSFTHGNVWALKLLFPFSQHRYRLLADTVGNWWEWTPRFSLPWGGISMPYLCVLIWVLLAGYVIYVRRQKKQMRLNVDTH